MFALSSSTTSTLLLLLSSTCFLSSIISAVPDAKVSKNEDENNPRYHVSILSLKDTEETISGSLIKGFCGGAIIHRRFVLTAAHCVFNRKPKELIVRTTGSRQVKPQNPVVRLANDNRTEEFRGIARIVYPREYTPGSRDHNIALIKVIGNFQTEDYKHFKVLHMPPVNANYTEKLATTILSTKVSELSQFVSTSTKVISNEDCQKLVEFNVTQKIVCSSRLCLKYGEGSVGDPLVYKDQVIGISQDTVGGRCDAPRVYTRVSEYVGFIVKTIRDQGFNFNF